MVQDVHGIRIARGRAHSDVQVVADSDTFGSCQMGG